MDGRQEGTGVYWQGLLFSQLELTNDLYEPHLLGIETCCVEYLVNSLDNFFFLSHLTFLLSPPLGMACVGAWNMAKMDIPSDADFSVCRDLLSIGDGS